MEPQPKELAKSARLIAAWVKDRHHRGSLMHFTRRSSTATVQGSNATEPARHNDLLEQILKEPTFLAR